MAGAMGEIWQVFFADATGKALANEKNLRQCDGMKTAAEIIAFVGKDAVVEKLGVGPDAVRVAVASGKLPAAWYAALENLAGRPLPRDVFSFKGAA